MSTRANIIVNCKNQIWSLFYHQCDGYPEGVGRMLCTAEWLTFFRSSYSDDALQFCEKFKRALTDVSDYFKFKDEAHLNDEGFKHSLRGDIEYLYTVDIQGESSNITITVRYIPIEYHDLYATDYRKLITKCLSTGTEIEFKFIQTPFSKVKACNE